MPRFLTRAARWYANDGKCSMRRLTPTEFDAHDFVMNSPIPADRRPVAEAFEVRDDQIGEVVGIVWSAEYALHQGARGRRFRWQYVDRRMDVRVSPPNHEFVGQWDYAWWVRDAAINWLLEFERNHRRSVKQATVGAEALDDFYI